jgi:hypothetical protein
MKKSLSVAKVLTTDYVSFISWLTPLVFLFSYLFTKNQHPGVATNLLYLTLGCSGGGAMLIFWRIWYFFNIFSNGLFVEGQILKVFFYRARGTINYTFLYRKQQYSKKIIILKAIHNFPYQIGDSITIAVDPENPHRSFIIDFFSKSN